MYKDKHLQREANRKASQRRRDKAKGVTMVPDKGMTTITPEQPTVTPITGPLGVYSAQRWSFLQSKGHVWDEARRRGVRSGPGSEIVGVAVPGDPGYEGIA